MKRISRPFKEETTLYTVERGWIDCAGKTRTWLLLSPDGMKVAEVTAKRDALRLTELLSRMN